MEDDTIKLLRECNAGIKMGISSLEDMINNVKNYNLKTLLKESWNTHCRLSTQTEEYLKQYHEEGKEPTPIAKAMSWMKTNIKLVSEETDKAVADLITDGCNMGIKSLYQYLNQYPAAKEKIKSLTKEVIAVEEKLVQDVRGYL